MPTDQPTDAQWHATQVLWRRLGFVSTPMPDGTVVPVAKGEELAAIDPASPPPRPRKPDPPRLSVTPPPAPPPPPKPAPKPAAAVDYKARAAGEREDDVPF